ncbi:unnamed protein product [Nesidiocoris tenuis]|uniref:Uncharacterized protein n=1 Tax=Nesidiocoris tenuis TaxID=355587 RepID=A0A6H5FZ04_9HEMI|nr:unnamed protein product [Nesidiocoris tenuis]
MHYPISGGGLRNFIAAIGRGGVGSYKLAFPSHVTMIFSSFYHSSFLSIRSWSAARRRPVRSALPQRVTSRAILLRGRPGQIGGKCGRAGTSCYGRIWCRQRGVQTFFTGA